MGKRPREENQTSSTSHLITTLEHKKKRRKEEETMEVKVEPELVNLPTDEYDVWLIRKPRSVDLKALANIKFPHIGKIKRTIVTCGEEKNAELHCYFMPVSGQMVHVPTSRIKTREEAMNIKAISEVNGLCVVSKMQTDDALDISDDKEAAGACLSIRSIRKNPMPILHDGTVKERLKAFGVIPKSKKRTLPNLS